MSDTQPTDTQLAPPPEPLEAKGYDVSAELLRDVSVALESKDIDTAQNLIEELHPADKAELLNLLPEEQRIELVEMLWDQFDHTILPELTPDAAEDVLETLGVDKSAQALAQLETDDAMHIIEEMNEEDRFELLKAIPRPIARELAEGLSYPEDSAGRLMTRKLVYVPEFWSVGDTIDYLRSHTDLPENFYVVYVIDPKFKPVGRVQLGRIMQNRRDVKISAIMQEETHSVSTDTDQEEVAYLFTKYALVEAPVVNHSGRLVGTITVDDVVHVIHEEEGEDYLRAGGVKSQDIQASLRDTLRQRFPWLFINLLTAVLASVVIGAYAETIEQLVALAVLMPIVASMGGNAGTQSVTVAVRALATRQLKSGNAGAALRKELMIGLLNGLVLAAIMAVGTYVWYQDMHLALVFGVATILTLMVAGFSGAGIPLLLSKLKIDPAVSSGVFLTTVTDVVGFLSFLGLGTLILM